MFVRGLVVGVALVFVAGVLINETPVADWIIAPLLVDDTSEPSDAIVALGAGVLDGCVPNENGVRRVLLAARLWRAGRAPVIVFTGGTGGACPVSRAMANLAAEIGVPAAVIRQEPASVNTYENGVVAAPLLRGWGIQRVLLVTDRLHMRRAAAVFRQLGFEVGQSSVPIGEGHDDNVAMLRAGLREFLALGYYRLRGRIAGDPANATSPRPSLAGVSHMTDGPIVILGASYALGWQPPTLAGVRVINRGVGGQQSFEMLARFDSDVVRERPRAVILWGFINDIFRAADVDAAATKVRESYLAMIARARQHGIEPVLATEVTIAPRSTTVVERVMNVVGNLRGKQSYQDGINRHVLAVNDWIVETAKRERLLVLHFQSVLAEPGGRRRARFAQPDGSHISEAGYDVLTSYAEPLLEEHFVERQ